jgi:hypothetical protein
VRIIAVDLPATSLWDTSGFGTDMFLLAALHYIFDRADKIAAAYGKGPLPLVVNISLGWSGGPHDGSGLLEAALAELITVRRAKAATALVLPSGNMFQDMLSATLQDAHFSPAPDDMARDGKAPDGKAPDGKAPDGKAQASLRWGVQPHDMTSTFAELWLAPGAEPAGATFSLTAPDGSVTSIGPAPGHADVTVAGRIVGQITLDRYRGQRWRVTICLAPTEPKALPPPPHGTPHGAAPAGDWRITVRRKASQTGAISLRVQRDADHDQGHTGGRQSHLLDPAYDPYAADGALAQVDAPGTLVHRFGGLNGLATSAVSLNIGGHVASLGQAARYSSAGLIGGRGVDASAPTDRSPALTGIVSAGTRTGSFVALQGTSSAAPQIARELAQAFLAAPPAAGPCADNYASRLINRPDIQLVSGAGQRPTERSRLGALRLT